MGYYVEILQSTFKIPAENLEKAYEKLCDLNYIVPNSVKSGGSYGGENDRNKAPEFGPHPGVWFSWMDSDYPNKCSDVEEILSALGFDIEYNVNNDLEIVGYSGKTGQEGLFLNAISSVSTGYIVWKGEQDEIWGETYGGKCVVTKTRNTPPDYSDIVSA